MEMTNIYINDQLNKAQQLLWNGSELGNAQAREIITKLINDRMSDKGE